MAPIYTDDNVRGIAMKPIAPISAISDFDDAMNTKLAEVIAK